MKRISKVACCGGGIIGSSFAITFAMKGYPCNIYARDEESVKRVHTKLHNVAASIVDLGILSQSAMDACLEIIVVTSDPEKAFRDVQFIQENGPEEYDAKQQILKTIEAHTDDDTIIASSTSGLLITKIAEHAKNPERCLGAHPYNPPHLIPLVEITRGEKTQDAYVDATVAFYRAVGKEPVVLMKERLGFIANRISHAVYREIVALVEDGVCTVEGADKALVYGPGLRWAIYGPNILYELGGGEGGISSSVTKYRTMSNLLFEDISDMKRIPDSWHDIAVAGVREELDHMPAFIGSSHAELAQFRDKVLVELLRLHEKI